MADRKAVSDLLGRVTDLRRKYQELLDDVQAAEIAKPKEQERNGEIEQTVAAIVRQLETAGRELRAVIASLDQLAEVRSRLEGA